jgi:hypoxanthine phosphoribosyltransferase
MANTNTVNMDWEESNLIKMTWQDYEDSVEILKDRLISGWPDFDYRMITGIPRGGLVLGVHLSHILNIPFVGFGQFLWTDEYKGAKILIVDDITHSGMEIMNLISRGGEELFKERFRFASLVTSEACQARGHIWKTALGSKKNDWIVFPWEKEPGEEEAKEMVCKHVGQSKFLGSLKNAGATFKKEEKPREVGVEWKFPGMDKNK